MFGKHERSCKCKACSNQVTTRSGKDSQSWGKTNKGGKKGKK